MRGPVIPFGPVVVDSKLSIIVDEIGRSRGMSNMSNMMVVDVGSIDRLRYRKHLTFGSGARSADEGSLRNKAPL